MNSRRFDPQDNTIPTERSPGYVASPQGSHTDYVYGTQPQQEVSNPLYSSHVGPNIPINMPQQRSEKETTEHLAHYSDSSSSSLSSHRQLKLEDIRSSAFGFSFPSFFSRGGLAVSMAVTGLLIVGFIGYSVIKGSTRQGSYSPPIIEADTVPVKVASQASTSKDEPNNKDMRIYEKISGNFSEQEAGAMSARGQILVSKNEIPLIESKSQLMSQNLAYGQDMFDNMDNTQVVFPPPKQVKTVIMRPDGTVVSQSIKKEEHRQPSHTLETSENLLSNSTPVARESKEREDALPRFLQKKNVGTSKKIADRYEDGAPNGGRGFSVQLAATSSEKEAITFFQVLKRRYGMLSEKTPTIYKANLGGKIVYRLRVKTVSHEESTTLCQSIQTQGGACFVARN